LANDVRALSADGARSPLCGNERKPISREPSPLHSLVDLSQASTGQRQAAIPCSPAPDG
jgi:hypothetical protein